MSDSDESYCTVQSHHKPDNESSGQWSYIFSQVQNDLPAMDSDSETTSSADESVGIFDRSLPTDKKTEEVGSVTNKPIKTVSPKHTTSVRPESTIAKKAQSPSVPKSTSLLFQRLQKHLKENVNTDFPNEEQIEDRKTPVVPVLDDSPFEAADVNQNVNEVSKESSNSATATEMSESSIFSEFEEIDVTSLLSLERLEDFDLSNIVEDSSTTDLSELSADSPREEPDKKEKTKVMNKLLDLCQKQTRLEDSRKADKPPKSESKLLKIEDGNNEGQHAAGRTTVFIDLRPNVNKKEKTEAQEVDMKPEPLKVQRPVTKSVGVSANDLPFASRRVQNMTKMHAISSDSESSDGEDIDQTWQIYRRKLKAKSIDKVTPTSSSKNSQICVTGIGDENLSNGDKILKACPDNITEKSGSDNPSDTSRQKHSKASSVTPRATKNGPMYDSHSNSAVQVIGESHSKKTVYRDDQDATLSSSSYSANRLKENPSYSRLMNQVNGVVESDSANGHKKSKSKDKKLQSSTPKGESYYKSLVNGSSIRNETRYKLKVLLDKEREKHHNGSDLLFDMTSSFEQEVHNIPPTLSTDDTQMVLLAINMLSIGQVILHRTCGGHKASPVDHNVGFSVTYPLLLSWLLALVPEDLDDIRKPRTDDTFSRDLDPHDLLEDINGKELTHVDVPFNVVSLNQYWREDTQSLSLMAVIVPNDFYNPDSKRVRKKSKREDAFLHVVRQFLQSNKIQDVCPWHGRPESPLHYTLAETDVTCAMKPLSTYVAASNDIMAIKKVLKSNPGFFSKSISSDECVLPSELSSSSKSEITTCLLQREAFMFPIAVLDIGIRLQTSCFDLVGLRLCYVPRRFIDENTSHYSYREEAEYQDAIVPCALLAIRGHAAHKTWGKTVGPRDPVLARMSEKHSLNATYGEQLSTGLHSMDVNLFYHPRSETRAKQQICVWFGGRVNPNSKIVKNLTQANCNGTANHSSPNCNGVDSGDKNDVDDAVFAFETSKNSTISNEFKKDSYIVTSPIQRIYLVISPQLPTRFISNVLCTVLSTGYHLIAARRLRLDERKSSALNIPQRNYPYFCPRLDPDASLDFDYYEDVWLFRPSTVLLISKENGSVHQNGLIHALQTDLMVSLSSPEEGHVKQVTCQCFHTASYSESAEHVIGVMNKAIDVESGNTMSLPLNNFLNISPNPEMEQVVVFCVIGDEAMEEGVEILRSLVHGDFPCLEDNIGADIYNMDNADEDYDMEPFNGFEVLGLKRISSLPKNLANELCLYEVGTKEWCRCILQLQNSSVLLVVMRRVNAFQVLGEVLSSMKSSNCDGNQWPHSPELPWMMSSSPETAYRQVNAFFSDKELFPDNQSRPLLKYLPPPARLLQYRLHQQVKCSCSCNNNCVGNCQQSNTNTPSKDNVKRGSSKKKKKSGKKDVNHKDSFHNGDGSVSAKHLSSLDESIYSFMTTCNQPLTSVLVIKPDAFPRHFIKIMRELHRQDFTIVAMNIVKMSEHEALQVAPSIIKEMQGECQVYLDHMLSDLSLVACVQRSNAIRHLCELAGPQNPQIARSRLYSRKSHESLDTRRPPTLRALFGIDLISNGIHVSDSYASACEEMKLFFPYGLCCKETQELAMECVPCPAVDPYMCTEKMKGRMAQVSSNKPGLGKRKIQNEDDLFEPVVTILMPDLLQNESPPQQNCDNFYNNRWKAPPYVAILDQLFNQGFEICAMRMVWCKQNQAEELVKILHYSDSNLNYIDEMKNGPVLVVMLQRKNAFQLFDSVLGSSKSNGDSLYYKYADRILRSKTLEETKQAARYIFAHVPNVRSALKISHNRFGWDISSSGDSGE